MSSAATAANVISWTPIMQANTILAASSSRCDATSFWSWSYLFMCVCVCVVSMWAGVAASIIGKPAAVASTNYTCGCAAVVP